MRVSHPSQFRFPARTLYCIRNLLNRKILNGFSILILSLSPILALANEEESFEIKYFKYSQGRIAFSYLKDQVKDIYYLDFGNLSVKPLITTTGSDESPVYSPNGQKILFQSDLSGDKEIYLASADGSGIIQLTNSPGNDENPSFSPDGQKIIFQSSRRVKDGSELFIMNSDGSKQFPLLTDVPQAKTKFVTPKYSPRGKELLFVSNGSWPGWDLMLYDLKTNQKQFLTEGLGSYLRPTWQGDGAAYAFVYRAGKISDIWLANKGEKSPQQLIKMSGQSNDPCFHDTEFSIFFVSEANLGREDYKLFVFDKKLQKDGQFLENQISPVLISKGNIRNPSWTPFPLLENIITKLKEQENNKK